MFDRPTRTLLLVFLLLWRYFYKLAYGRWMVTFVPVFPDFIFKALGKFLSRSMTLIGCPLDEHTCTKETMPGYETRSIMGSHPHGCYVTTALTYFGYRCRANLLQPQVFGFVADSLFTVPVLGELMLLFNQRPARASLMKEFLTKCPDATALLVPGGVHEQLRTNPEQEVVYLPPKLGFIRLAIETGIPLRPNYLFGENQLFDVPEWSRNFSLWMYRKFGFGIPIIFGRWGIPFGLPLPGMIHARCGNLVPVVQNSDPTDQMVEAAMRRYVAELGNLFLEHGAQCLPAKVAERGLRVIWRGHGEVGHFIPTPDSRTSKL